jgi:putative transposase
MTPHDVHTGLAEMRYAQRETVLQRAFEISPERFVRGLPKPPALPQKVWINKPKEQDESTEELLTKLEEEVSHFH